jgi:hypothetical protein
LENDAAAAARAAQEQAGAMQRYTKYQTDPAGYARDVLGFDPWAGCNGEPGQLEIYDAIGESCRAQLAGEPAIKWHKANAGHGVGKTWGAAGLANWFLDSFTPSIVMTTAPTAEQVEKLLWKDIKTQRREESPGEVMSGPEIRITPDHFAIGKTTSDNGGQGTERFQGQHGPHLLFILDEAEGVPDFVFDAIDSMTTGGLVIVLMLANPRTRTSRYHRTGLQSGVACYRLSCLDHPNVVHNREMVPHAVTRGWVDERIERWCEVTDAHDDDTYTFEVPWRAGIIYRPNAEFLFRVMGIPPKTAGADALIGPGRYESACKREPVSHEPTRAWMGLDAARGGSDYGTLYTRHDGRVWRSAQLYHSNSLEYLEAIKVEARKLHAFGVTSLHIRVDGSGGFGAGPIDLARADSDLGTWFSDFQVFEVHFGGGAKDSTKYADTATEMYGETAETLRGVTLVKPPAELEDDLTGRLCVWKNLAGRAVRRLEPKVDFKKRKKRSPDDGDGLVLCLAPDHMFENLKPLSESTTTLIDVNEMSWDDLFS